MSDIDDEVTRPAEDVRMEQEDEEGEDVEMGQVIDDSSEEESDDEEEARRIREGFIVDEDEDEGDEEDGDDATRHGFLSGGGSGGQGSSGDSDEDDDGDGDNDPRQSGSSNTFPSNSQGDRRCVYHINAAWKFQTYFETVLCLPVDLSNFTGLIHQT